MSHCRWKRKHVHIRVVHDVALRQELTVGLYSLLQDDLRMRLDKSECALLTYPRRQHLALPPRATRVANPPSIHSPSNSVLELDPPLALTLRPWIPFKSKVFVIFRS